MHAAIAAINLCEIELLVGEAACAVATAERATTHADRSGDAFNMIVSRTAHADALHTAGRHKEAEESFGVAERLQKKSDPEIPLLYSVQGYQYCELLLARGNWADAQERAAQTLEWLKHEYPLLAFALDTLMLGRTHLGLAMAAQGAAACLTERQDNVRMACARLNEAVDGLRAAGTMHQVPRGLLARAAFWRSIGDWMGVARDLEEVEEIAEPGPMKLFLCDLAIERARLAFAQIEAFAPLNGLLESNNPPKPTLLGADEIARLKDEAKKQFNIAADYSSSCGYHRRDEELAELQAVLRGERTFGSLSPRV